MTNAPEGPVFAPVQAYDKASFEADYPSSDLIERAKLFAAMEDVLSDHVLPVENRPSHASNAKLIRDLIAALQAAPTADELRGWADHLADCGMDGRTAGEMRAAADRMDGGK